MGEFRNVSEKLAGQLPMWREAIHAMRVLAMALVGCECPSPTHRMSCGVGAQPRVIQDDDYDYEEVDHHEPMG